MKKILALVATVLLATACTEAPASTALAPIRFTQPPMKVSVAQVRVENLTPALPGAVDAQMPTPPAAAVTQWVNDRLVAAGSSGYMVVSMQNASMIETKLAKTDGIKGFFTDDQDAKYTGTLVVNFRLFNGISTTPVAEANVNVARGRSINEDATLAQRELFYHQLVSDMMQAFNGEAETQLRRFMGTYMGY